MGGRYGVGGSSGVHHDAGHARSENRFNRQHAAKARANKERREGRELEARNNARNPKERAQREQSMRHREEMISEMEQDANEGLQNRANDESSAPEAGESGYQVAIDMCGNNGQLAIIQDMGVDTFIDYAEDVESGDEGTSLAMNCSHPEAVGEILDSAEAEIEAYLIEDAAEQELEDEGYGEGYDD